MAQSVEFKTVDGITLRGNLFLAPPQPDGTPIVIMTQGLTLLKEHFLPNWGAKFVEVGYSVLIYDHRGWGSSDKSHEGAVNPMQQAEGYHDAVLYAQSLPEIDPSRIAIRGIGHSGGASMIAAGDDPYIKAVILMMPFFSGAWDATNWPEGIMGLVHDERRRIVTETPRPAPDYLKSWDSSPEEAASSHRGSTLIHGQVLYEFARNARQLSDQAGIPWDNRITLQSLHHISKVEPQDHIHKISPRPMLYLAATVDPISGPLDAQKATFARAGEPKQFVQLDSDHLSNYKGALFDANVLSMIQLLKKYLQIHT